MREETESWTRGRGGGAVEKWKKSLGDRFLKNRKVKLEATGNKPEVRPVLV